MYLSGRTAVQFQFQSGTLAGETDHRMPLPRPLHPPTLPRHVFISRFLPAARAAAAAPYLLPTTSPKASPPSLPHLENEKETNFFFFFFFIYVIN